MGLGYELGLGYGLGYGLGLGSGLGVGFEDGRTAAGVGSVAGSSHLLVVVDLVRVRVRVSGAVL